ncbi:hypothetical protein HYPSUDRAFT_202183 [Hypholoma sublateritium FD-334 SS-4]|uniref:Uncharacterized protein n=1 Tax=Hypholoma sublateritium (strain FD-334 SS-4) TaxID=945553 RepID=A0A0D2NU41_HYPSF|nr:hypothetical protein HYPSUDRAFT_202183 [Hypholoma sublateritium FD-334 SS-4]
MSQFVFGAPSTPHFNFNHGGMINCHKCGQFVEYRPCKSNSNGNKGRPVAIFIDDDGKACNFIRWQPGSSRPATESPAPPSAPQNTTQAPQTTVAAASGKECRTLGCNSRRIRKDCRSRLCKKHCIEAGGCLSPPHLVSKETACQDSLSPPPNPAIPSSLSTNPCLLPNHLPPRSQQTLPTTMSATAVQPTFSSHMSPIFTQQMASEQELQAKRRTSEMAKVENARRAKHTVIAYAWTQENADPNIVKFQAGFTWPHFEINQDILEDLDLATTRRLKLFDMRLGVWTTIQLPHTVTVSEQLFSIFLKPSNLVSTKDLPRYAAFPKHPVPHMRTNLAGERAYIKDRMSNRELQALSSRTPKVSTTPREPYMASTALTKVVPLFIGPKLPKKRKIYTTSSEEIADSTDDEDEDLQSPTPVRRLFVLPSPSVRRHSDDHIKQEDLLSGSSAQVPALSKTWPGDFHVVDIVSCFKESADASKSGKKVKDIFERHFPVPFKRSTFYENRGRWDHAPLQAKQQALDAGCTSAGLWSTFMGTNRAPRAELKAARRISSRASTSSTVIDLTISGSDGEDDDNVDN